MTQRKAFPHGVLRVLGLILLIGSGLLGLCFLFLFYILGGVILGPSVTKEDLIENYYENRQSIEEAGLFINSVAPKECEVYVEFESDDVLMIKSWDKSGAHPSKWYAQHYGVAIDSDTMDTILRKYRWNPEVLRVLKEKLDRANCVSVESGEPCQVGFSRSGMGMFFYRLFKRPMTDSTKEQYNDGCHYIYLNSRTALEYGGGAFGPQCFPKPSASE